MAVAASDPALAAQIRDRLVGDKEAKARVDVVAPAAAADRARLVAQGAGRATRRLSVDRDTAGQVPTAPYTSPSSGDFITAARLKSALTHATYRHHLTARGMTQERCRQAGRRR